MLLRVLRTSPLMSLVLTTTAMAAADVSKTPKETRQDRQYVQRCLTWFGFEPGAADGSLNRRTREALAAYAHSRESNLQPDAVGLRSKVRLECIMTGLILTAPEVLTHLSEDDKTIRKIQYCLTRLGRYRRAINGKMEPALQEVLEQYMREKGVTMTAAGYGTTGQVLLLDCQPYLADLP
jgi:hypothetical protein